MKNRRMFFDGPFPIDRPKKAEPTQKRRTIDVSDSLARAKATADGLREFNERNRKLFAPTKEGQ